MSLNAELLALTTCKGCDSKNVAMTPVPGGMLEFICDDCHEIWTYEPEAAKTA